MWVVRTWLLHICTYTFWKATAVNQSSPENQCSVQYKQYTEERTAFAPGLLKSVSTTTNEVNKHIIPGLLNSQQHPEFARARWRIYSSDRWHRRSVIVLSLFAFLSILSSLLLATEYPIPLFHPVLNVSITHLHSISLHAKAATLPRTNSKGTSFGTAPRPTYGPIIVIYWVHIELCCSVVLLTTLHNCWQSNKNLAWHER